MQLGKLDVSQEVQSLNSKTEDNHAQYNQKLTSKKQNASIPASTAWKRPKERPFGTWGDAFSVMRDVIYGMLPFMDLYEQATLAFIFGRTRLWKKDWEFIPLRHFMKGVWSKDGECTMPRIRISEASLLKAINSLEAKKIIEVDRSFRKNRYRIRTRFEIETDENYSQIRRHILLNQPALLAMMVSEMESRRSLLDETDLSLISSYREVIKLHETGRISNGTITGEVDITSPAREEPELTPSPVREHKIPIVRKIKKPNIALAPQEQRRFGLKILPSPSQQKLRVKLGIEASKRGARETADRAAKGAPQCAGASPCVSRCNLAKPRAADLHNGRQMRKTSSGFSERKIKMLRRYPSSSK